MLIYCGHEHKKYVIAAVFGRDHKEPVFSGLSRFVRKHGLDEDRDLYDLGDDGTDGYWCLATNGPAAPYTSKIPSIFAEQGSGWGVSLGCPRPFPCCPACKSP